MRTYLLWKAEDMSSLKRWKIRVSVLRKGDSPYQSSDFSTSGLYRFRSRSRVWAAVKLRIRTSGWTKQNKKALIYHWCLICKCISANRPDIPRGAVQGFREEAGESGRDASLYFLRNLYLTFRGKQRYWTHPSFSSISLGRSTCSFKYTFWSRPLF